VIFSAIKESFMKVRLWCATAATIAFHAIVALGGPPPPHDVVKEPTTQPSQAGPLDFSVKTIKGTDQNLADFKGKVVMIVNVASKCGFTPQYKALEALYAKYSDQGFVIVGFPANNFHQQEPGTDAEIEEFCKATYDVQFPMMAKISVLGADQAPLYQFLTDPQRNGDFGFDIGWNFTKFIVDRNDNVIARFASQTKPDAPAVVAEIEKALAAKSAAK
jgi:glutathione peroxidase